MNSMDKDKSDAMLNVKEKHINPQELAEILAKYELVPNEGESLDSMIQKLMAKRTQARKNNQYELGDSIRKDLSSLDILLEDQADKTIYRIVSGADT